MDDLTQLIDSPPLLGVNVAAGSGRNRAVRTDKELVEKLRLLNTPTLAALGTSDGEDGDESQEEEDSGKVGTGKEVEVEMCGKGGIEQTQPRQPTEAADVLFLNLSAIEPTQFEEEAVELKTASATKNSAQKAATITTPPKEEEEEEEIVLVPVQIEGGDDEDDEEERRPEIGAATPPPPQASAASGRGGGSTAPLEFSFPPNEREYYATAENFGGNNDDEEEEEVLVPATNRGASCSSYFVGSSIVPRAASGQDRSGLVRVEPTVHPSASSMPPDAVVACSPLPFPPVPAVAAQPQQRTSLTLEVFQSTQTQKQMEQEGEEEEKDVVKEQKKITPSTSPPKVTAAVKRKAREEPPEVMPTTNQSGLNHEASRLQHTPQHQLTSTTITTTNRAAKNRTPPAFATTATAAAAAAATPKPISAAAQGESGEKKSESKRGGNTTAAAAPHLFTVGMVAEARWCSTWWPCVIASVEQPHLFYIRWLNKKKDGSAGRPGSTSAPRWEEDTSLTAAGAKDMRLPKKPINYTPKVATTPLRQRVPLKLSPPLQPATAKPVTATQLVDLMEEEDEMESAKRETLVLTPTKQNSSNGRFTGGREEAPPRTSLLLGKISEQLGDNKSTDRVAQKRRRSEDEDGGENNNEELGESTSRGNHDNNRKSKEAGGLEIIDQLEAVAGYVGTPLSTFGVFLLAHSDEVASRVEAVVETMGGVIFSSPAEFVSFVDEHILCPRCVALSIEPALSLSTSLLRVALAVGVPILRLQWLLDAATAAADNIGFWSISPTAYQCRTGKGDLSPFPSHQRVFAGKTVMLTAQHAVIESAVRAAGGAVTFHQRAQRQKADYLLTVFSKGGNKLTLDQEDLSGMLLLEEEGLDRLLSAFYEANFECPVSLKPEPAFKMHRPAPIAKPLSQNSNSSRQWGRPGRLSPSLVSSPAADRAVTTSKRMRDDASDQPPPPRMPFTHSNTALTASPVEASELRVRGIQIGDDFYATVSRYGSAGTTKEIVMGRVVEVINPSDGTEISFRLQLFQFQSFSLPSSGFKQTTIALGRHFVTVPASALDFSTPLLVIPESLMQHVYCLQHQPTVPPPSSAPPALPFPQMAASFGVHEIVQKHSSNDNRKRGVKKYDLLETTTPSLKRTKSEADAAAAAVQFLWSSAPEHKGASWQYSTAVIDFQEIAIGDVVEAFSTAVAGEGPSARTAISVVGRVAALWSEHSPQGTAYMKLAVAGKGGTSGPDEFCVLRLEDLARLDKLHSAADNVGGIREGKSSMSKRLPFSQ